MSLADITASAVKSAIEEFEKKGREIFLKEYGFAESHQYWLLHNDKRYPSKAIAGVAHKFSNGKALRADEFTGGVATVVAQLERLGFAIEKMKRNPAWTEDELVLALQLYLTNPMSPPGKSSDAVRKLSWVLNKMHRILGTDASETLRNENGVYMKMMNFRAIDPAFIAQGKAGMKAGGQLEKVVWSKYADDPAALEIEANRIRNAIGNADLTSLENLPDQGEAAGEEGGVVMRLHKRYERDRSIIRKKLSAAKEAGDLSCEVCEFDFEARFGALGEGYIEVHHLKPVHTLGKGSKTKLSDLALLCANCHRMAHRKRTPLSLDELRAARSGKDA